MPQRCQTYRGVSYNAADGCSPNSTLLVPRNFGRTACTSPAPAGGVYPAGRLANPSGELDVGSR